MKAIALALGTLAAAAAPAVLAQQYIEMPAPHTERGYVYVPVNPSNPVGPAGPVNPDAVVSDPYWTGRREHGLNDYGNYRGERYYDYREDWARRDYRRFRDVECWNPRARHFEEVRQGEYQNDLDFSRCRSARSFGWR
jgi:hypothetical protein